MLYPINIAIALSKNLKIRGYIAIINGKDNIFFSFEQTLFRFIVKNHLFLLFHSQVLSDRVR